MDRREEYRAWIFYFCESIMLESWYMVDADADTHTDHPS
jgi:hypothetical protein